MKPIYRTVFAVLLVGVGISAEAFDRENLTVDADATLVWDDNQSQALKTRNKVEEHSLVGGAAFGYSHLISQTAMLSGSAFAEQEIMDEVSPLDRTTLGLKGAFRWQPSSAFTAPIVEFNLSWQDDNYADEGRDSGVLISQLFVTRRITDRVTGTAGLQYRNRDSAGTVWDLEDARIFLNGDYAVGHAALYFTYSYLKGDSFSSAQRVYCNGNNATDILPLINIATAIEADEAYNEYHCGDWLAYRIDSHAHTTVFGANYGFSHSFSADFSVLYADVIADDDADISYQRRLIRASLLKRF